MLYSKDGLFEVISFTLNVDMDFRSVMEFMGNILEKNKMDPQFRMFTDINSVVINRYDTYGDSTAPKVNVSIEGSVLNFVKK